MGFLILFFATLLLIGYYLFAKVYNYWQEEPLLNLDMPLLLNNQKDFEGNIRLVNNGDYSITIKDVKLTGQAFQLAAQGWRIEPEKKIQARTGLNQASLELYFSAKQASLDEETTLIITYDYGLFRRNLNLEIKTELP